MKFQKFSSGHRKFFKKSFITEVGGLIPPLTIVCPLALFFFAKMFFVKIVILTSIFGFGHKIQCWKGSLPDKRSLVSWGELLSLLRWDSILTRLHNPQHPIVLWDGPWGSDTFFIKNPPYCPSGGNKGHRFLRYRYVSVSLKDTESICICSKDTDTLSTLAQS